MGKITLNAQIREDTGKSASRRLRNNYMIPAVVYKQAEKTLPIQVKTTDFIHILHTAAGENAIVTLKIVAPSAETKSKSSEAIRTVIIKEIQYHPTKENILHIDFQEISLTEKITVKVPIVLKGEAVGVKTEGGILEQMTKELEIECLPTEIPEKIEFNIEAMKIGDIVHVKELEMPADVKVLVDSEQAVVSVSPPKVEEVPVAEEVAEEAIEEPEVITEKKAEEREAEAAAEEKEKKPEKEEL